jgi:hypothetical protein
MRSSEATHVARISQYGANKPPKPCAQQNDLPHQSRSEHKPERRESRRRCCTTHRDKVDAARIGHLVRELSRFSRVVNDAEVVAEPVHPDNNTISTHPAR